MQSLARSTEKKALRASTRESMPSRTLLPLSTPPSSPDEFPLRSVRQMTNWGSRMGFARLAEQGIRKARGKTEGDSLGALDKIAASTVGGALGTWNQPIEVVRVEMQSMAKQTNANRPAKMTVFK